LHRAPPGALFFLPADDRVARNCTDNLNRFVRVLDAGYTIGEDILVTHEDRQNPLRLERVDGIIEKFLK